MQRKGVFGVALKRIGQRNKQAESKYWTFLLTLFTCLKLGGLRFPLFSTSYR